MIRVAVRSTGITMDGHAGCGRHGIDIVCAAVSALTCGLIHALQSLTDNRIRADTDSGQARICWEKLDDSGRLLVDSWFLAITDINMDYQCIEYV